MKDGKTSLVILDDEIHIIKLLEALIPWDTLGISYEGNASNGIAGKALISTGNSPKNANTLAIYSKFVSF